MTKATELYQKPVYSDELFKSFYPMICKVINDTVLKLPQGSENIDRYEDYVQRCRIWLWEHCELYDATRTGKNGKICKFSTYMHMVFYSRLGAIRNNLLKKRKDNICVDFSNLMNPQSLNENTNNDISYLSEDVCVDIDFTMLLKEKLIFLQKLLPPEKFGLYKEYFLDGNQELSSLSEKYFNPEYNQIKETINELKKIHEDCWGINVKSRKQVRKSVQPRSKKHSAFCQDNVGHAIEFAT
jgi:hypothetical protein